MAKRYWDAELETAPWDEVLRWQAARAVPFVRALPERSEFHCALLGHAAGSGADGAAGLEFLADLPFTSKDQIRRSQADRRPGEPFGRHQGVPLPEVVQTLSSSGTTGEPVMFALTAADLEVWRDGIAAGFFTAGIRPDDVVAHLVGLPGVAGGLPYADGFRRIGAALAWIGGLPTERIITLIPRLQATAVLSTTSFGTYLADRCQELTGQDASSLGVRTLLGGGEPGMGAPEIRDKIIRGWGLERACEVMGLRYDTPIPVDVEAAPGLAAGRYDEMARAIERELRARLQIRADVTILDPGSPPRTTYKTPLLHVREAADGGGT